MCKTPWQRLSNRQGRGQLQLALASSTFDALLVVCLMMKGTSFKSWAYVRWQLWKH